MPTLMKRIIPINMRKLFFPFVGVMTGLIVAYSFLNWLFIVRTSQFVFNLVWIETWIPVVVSACVVRYWLVPKLHDVHFIVERTKRLMLIITFLIIAVTMHFSQVWVESSYSKAQHLSRITEVNIEPKKRFYEINRGYYIDKTLMGHYEYEYLRSVGRNAHHYCSEIYVVFPVFEKNDESKEHRSPIVWLAILFKNEATSESERDEFFIQKMQYLEKSDLNAFYYLERKTNSNMFPDKSSYRFQRAIKNGRYTFPIQQSPLILLADYRSFSERVRNNIEEAIGVWIFSVLIWFGMVYLLIDEGN